MERLYEHMWLFKHKKEGDPDKNESNSTLWVHSKVVHDSTMSTSNWKVEVTSSHKSPLSRQISEAVRISREPKSNLLNSKQEFGANNLAEIALQYGNQFVTHMPQMRGREEKGAINFKRKRREHEDDEDTEPGLHSL